MNKLIAIILIVCFTTVTGCVTFNGGRSGYSPSRSPSSTPSNYYSSWEAFKADRAEYDRIMSKPRYHDKSENQGKKIYFSSCYAYLPNLAREGVSTDKFLSQFTGSCIDKKSEGLGIARWLWRKDKKKIKGIYIGELSGGDMTGLGSLTTEEFRFEGEFVNGFPRMGKQFQKGLRFEGMFNDDGTYQKGIKFYDNGSFAAGKFVNGKLKGPGVFKEGNRIFKVVFDGENGYDVVDTIDSSQALGVALALVLGVGSVVVVGGLLMAGVCMAAVAMETPAAVLVILV